MFLPANSVDAISNEPLDLSDLRYAAQILFMQMNQEDKEYEGLSIEQFAFDNDMDDGGVNRIGDMERTTGGLVFEEVDQGRICTFKFVPKVKGLLGLFFSYSEELLDETDRKRPQLNFTETCCAEIAVINNVKIGGDPKNFHLIDNDTLAWKNSGFELDLTNEEFVRSGFCLFQVN